MKYLTVELQTASDGTVSHIVNVYNDLKTALQQYHTVLSYASVSTLPAHGCVILTSEGSTVRSEMHKGDN